MARIAVAGFRHETNSFAPVKATFPEFELGYSWPPLTRGAGIVEALTGYNLGLAGFNAEAGRLGHELVPLVWASASPSAEVTEDAYERIVGMLLEDLEAAGPVDAVYLGLHGAMTVEHVDDGEGELLRRVRALVGPDLPVAVTLDYHANVTREMVERATVMLGYRTYPHEDMAATGARMARWLDRHLADPQPVARHLRLIPFLIPLVSGCTYVEPARGIVARLAELEGEDDLLTFAGGFPATNVPHCGPAVFGYGRDGARVTAAVDALADLVEAAEAEWAGSVLPAADAVALAIDRAHKAARPVVIADVQDNPGAGGTSDTTGLLRALLSAGVDETALAMMYDPHVATIAHRAGPGAEITVSLGGKHDVAGDTSFDGTFRVVSTPEGRFTGTGPLYGGAHLDLSPMAVIAIGGIEIVVGGRRVQAADLEMFRHAGIEPETRRILALKSSVHFRGHFEPIADSVILAEAPGPMPWNSASLPFTRLRPGCRPGPLAG